MYSSSFQQEQRYLYEKFYCRKYFFDRQANFLKCIASLKPTNQRAFQISRWATIKQSAIHQQFKNLSKQAWRFGRRACNQTEHGSSGRFPKHVLVACQWSHANYKRFRTWQSMEQNWSTLSNLCTGNKMFWGQGLKKLTQKTQAASKVESHHARVGYIQTFFKSAWILIRQTSKQAEYHSLNIQNIFNLVRIFSRQVHKYGYSSKWKVHKMPKLENNGGILCAAGTSNLYIGAQAFSDLTTSNPLSFGLGRS
eukprot:TRINITY_DN8833_c0_g1_i2.p1 TRINITY_DN8833_c0_g1~~TRINITY_DN8833_c0_g1_i2.p1  ORF type:complete len:252 (+),score=-13.98 TRINITY_DN8833_c0_g1_i2:355-1110(+)